MASEDDNEYKKFDKVVAMYEDGNLLGQKHTSSRKKLTDMPLYQFRTLSTLSTANKAMVLDMLLKKQLDVSSISKEIKRAQVIQMAQRQICAETGVKDWAELEQMFPRHMTREVLSHQFGQVSDVSMMEEN